MNVPTEPCCGSLACDLSVPSIVRGMDVERYLVVLRGNWVRRMRRADIC